MTFISSTDRARAAAPTSGLMRTPDYLNALASKPARRVNWHKLEARIDIRSSEVDALDKAAREIKRRKKIAENEVTFQVGKHFLADGRLNSFEASPLRGERLVHIFCEVTGIRYEELKGTARYAKVANPRQALYWILRTQTGASFSAIGRRLCRDHTSVINGVSKVTTDSKRLASARALWDKIYDIELERYG